jgi:hypothetical protein
VLPRETLGRGTAGTSTSGAAVRSDRIASGAGTAVGPAGHETRGIAGRPSAAARAAVGVADTASILADL